MLLTLALIALLALTVFGTFGVLADCALRGWNAYRLLSRQAGLTHVVMPEARSIETVTLGNLPGTRTASQPRYGAAINAPRSARHRLSVAA